MNEKQGGLMAAILAAALCCVATAAEETVPTAAPATQEATEAPAQPEVKPEAKPEAAKPETKPAPEPKAETPKELTPCAKTFVPLADSYKKAYEELEKWIGDVDTQTTAATAKIDKIQEQIEKNEAAITKLKLQATREGSANGRELVKNNKTLWSDLSATRKESAALCAGFAREAVQKARRYQSDVAAKLEGVKAQLP